jgi:hypothetical protein
MGNEAVRVMENIPIINYGVALGHAIDGNNEAAERAALRGTFNALTLGIAVPMNMAADVIAENQKEDMLKKLDRISSHHVRAKNIRL